MQFRTLVQVILPLFHCPDAKTAQYHSNSCKDAIPLLTVIFVVSRIKSLVRYTVCSLIGSWLKNGMLDWNNIDLVLLDMDGTLLDLHFDNHFWLEHLPVKYAEHHDVDKQEALDQLILHMEQKKGQLEWYCLDYWSEATGLPIAELKVDLEHKIQFRPHAQDFLKALKALGKRSVIVTNAHRDSVNLKMAKTGLDVYVDRVISSHDYRHPKEAQNFWITLQQEEPFDLKRTVLIDDSEAVLESAQIYGIEHLLCIVQPDSQKPRRTLTRFKAVDHFHDILPTNDKVNPNNE